MTPLQFEAHYQHEWDELQSLLAHLRGGPKRREPIAGERVASLYRRACEQLALARARSYPAYIVERLNELTADAHQLIYQRQEFGLTRLKRMIAFDFPRAVRAHSSYVWLSTAVFVIPMIVLGLLVFSCHSPA